MLAGCARIESMAPAQDFQVHEQRAAEGGFRGTADDRVKVELTCAGGEPRLRVAGR